MRAMNQARKTRRTQALADLVPKCLGEALAAQGFADAEIVTRWSEIAGERLAARSRPLKLTFPRGKTTDQSGARRPAVLLIEVAGAFALELQMQAPVLIERINRYFGWRCVGEIRMKQTAFTPPAPRPVPSPADAALVGRIAEHAQGFDEDRLAEAILRLGIGVAQRSRSGG